MNILIPAAGSGSRFKEQGYLLPKPMIEVRGKPMIQHVIESLNLDGRYIFLVQREHCEKFGFASVLKSIVPDCIVLPVNGVTQGAACTSLLAESFINNENPLVIANSDQFIKYDSKEFMESFMYQYKDVWLDGNILTFKATHPKWSFARSTGGFVKEVAEKYPISDDATVGVYGWASGARYVSCAKKMIEKNIRVNNEFYICPVYNELLQEGGHVRIQQIKEMWGLGTPEDLKYFLENYNG